MTVTDVTPSESDPLEEDRLAVLLRLEAQDKLTAENVVAEAEDPENPLHDLFPWDNAYAGYQYRLTVARSVIRRLRIQVETAPDTRISPRRFTFIGSEGRYKRTERALVENGPEVKAACRSELQSFKRKWATLEGLFGIVTDVFPPDPEGAS